MKTTVYGGREMNATKGRDRKHLWIMVCAVMIIGLGLVLMVPAMADSLPVESETTLWTDGNTYVVEDEVAINEMIEVQGTVILYLEKDGILTASKGIYVPENSSLTIEGTGELVACGDKTQGSGIGANENAGTIIINGGTITANGNYDAPGIGAKETNFGSITINGGIVNAIGARCAAGIGGGQNTEGSITINGGTVTATGGEDGSGIGSAGGYSAVMNITITGGTVTATGVRSSAGIGGGFGTITITGGKVTAISDTYGFGIGSTYGGNAFMTNIILGWTNSDDFIQSTSYCGQLNFAQDQSFFLDGTNIVATIENIENRRIVPCTEELFSITVDAADYGTIYTDQYLAPADAYITLTSVPETQYELYDITVAGTSGSIVPKEMDDGVWCFKMPEHNVKVTAVFGEERPVSLTTSEGTKDCLRVWQDITEYDSQMSEWFAVMKDTTIQERVTITGDVKLYLRRGKTLTCEAGIRVTEGNSLTIEGDGILIAKAPNEDLAGIGSNSRKGKQEKTGNILIRGGTIRATGSQFGAGIGGGYDSSGGTITISGGEVHATGGRYSAGIGGGQFGSGGNITISGGLVYATGVEAGAGIGGGQFGSGGNITISGGLVYATGVEAGAGIGGGNVGSSGSITISGGQVYATGGKDSAGIGSGTPWGDGNITISGGQVYATGVRNRAAIGSGTNGTITISGGRIVASNEFDPESGIGDDEKEIILGWTNPDDYIESCGYSGTIRFAEGNSFLRSDTLQAVETAEQMAGVRIIPQAGERYNITTSCNGDGSISADTRTAVEGQRVNLTWTTPERYIILKSLTVKDSDDHDIPVTRTGREDAFFTMPAGDVTVSAEIGRALPVRVTTSAGEKDCMPISSVLNFTDYSSGWYAVTEDTTIPARTMITGDVKLYLCEGTTLTCSGGINVDGDNSLTIEGQGTLIANASWYDFAAGIGGNKTNGGNITIHSGNIEARGGYLAAGIGGGNSGSAGRITIDGGTVTSTCGDYGAGIGGGTNGSGGSITISGGTVCAYGDSGAGIGSGSYGSGGSITISGGTVRAYGSRYCDGIGGGLFGQGGDISLGLSDPNDSIYSSSYGGNVIFEPNKYLMLRDTGEFATKDNIGGQVLVPYNGGIYSVSIENNPNGSVDSVWPETRKTAVILNRAVEGNMIHVECTTGYPYNITGLTVTGEQGENIAVTKLDDDVLHTEFRFEMPAGNVTIHLETIEIQYHKISLDVEEGRNITSVAEDLSRGYKLKEAYQGIKLYVNCESCYETVVTGLTIITEHGQNVPVTQIDQVSFSFVMPGDNITIRPEVTERATVSRNTTKGEKQCINLDEHINVWRENGADGWYTLTRDVTIDYTIYVRDGGDIGLYLGEGTTLKCAGIYVFEGCSLTIEGPGTLIADAAEKTMSGVDIVNGNYVICGIGGNGSVIINSGNITAYGGKFSAGIGGTSATTGADLAASQGAVTIRGGNVTAYGGHYAAGIGGGYRQDYGTVTISGGMVHAYGGPSGAGIGGGAYSPGKVVISGGNVTAVGGWEGAGIGGGSGGTGNVTISGGTVSASGGGSPRTADASSGGYGAGIGDGALAYGQGGTVRITGGKITANGGTRHYNTSSGIGSGGNSKLTEPGTIILGWTDPDDYICASAYGGNVSFADGQLFRIDGQNTLANADNIGGVRIVPVSAVYTVTVDGNTENGSITADQSVMFDGGTVTLTVTPDAGYETESVTVMQGSTPVDVTDNQFIMPAGDVSVTAAFSRKKYSITSVAENGTAIADKQTAYFGETVTLTLSPADDRYRLSSLEVLCDDQLIETTNTGDETCTFVMPEGEVTVKAAFCRQYFICFVNRDGTVLQWYDLEAGKTPVYTGETPQFEASAEYSFSFNGWTPEFAPVSGDTTYTASYTEIRRSYPVHFVNWDGYELQSDELPYGETPVYTEEEPWRVPDELYKYEFSGWTPEIAEVTGETTYTATFRAVPILKEGINMVHLNENEPVNCSFTPAKDGNYRFWSTAEGDILPIFHIYDQNGDPVETESFIGQNFNIDCLTELKGGKTYSVKLESLHGAIDLPIQVKMVKMHNVSIRRGMAHGSISCSTTAFTGQVVSFHCTPEEGYAPDVLVIEGADGSRTEISATGDEIFVMPDTDITVFGYFSPVYSIMVNKNEITRVSGISVDDMNWGADGLVLAKPGQTVEVAWPDVVEGYEIDTLAITTDTGRAVPYRITRNQWNLRVIRFIMPDAPVTVTITTREFTFGTPDFTLPAAITRIEEEAFDGAAMAVVYIPDTCRSIGAHAFRNCKELTKIRIPEQCSIGEDAFEGCDWVYVFGTSDSDADIYCRLHSNCQFVEE